MRIILIEDRDFFYDLDDLPNSLFSEIKDINNWRIELAEMLYDKLNMVSNKECSLELGDGRIESELGYGGLLDTVKITKFWENPEDHTCSAKVYIEEVDTSKIWKISNGGRDNEFEYVQYFEGVKIINKETNQSEW